MLVLFSGKPDPIRETLAPTFGAGASRKDSHEARVYTGAYKTRQTAWKRRNAPPTLMRVPIYFSSLTSSIFPDNFPYSVLTRSTAALALVT